MADQAEASKMISVTNERSMLILKQAYGFFNLYFYYLLVQHAIRTAADQSISQVEAGHSRL